MYGCETWSTTKGDEGKLPSLERKILRKTYGPVRNPDNGQYERRKNADIGSLFNRPSIQIFLLPKRIEWVGHVWRAEHDLINNVLTNNQYGKRPHEEDRDSAGWTV